MSAPVSTGVAFRRIREGNAFEETVERLLEIVKLGQIREGERLPPERELAASLGVSRVTLRQAIRSVASEGYLESRRGRAGGTFVLPAEMWRRDRRDLRDIAADMGDELQDALVLRSVVEPGTAEVAARRPHAKERARQLRDLLAELERVDVHDYRRLDSRLHIALAGLAGSPSLAAAVADVRMRLNELLDAIPLLPPNLTHANAQHERIVAAILDGRPGDARAAMLEHLEGTAALLRGFLA